MHCATCAMTIEKSLKKVAGVASAKVNFIFKNAIVEYDEAKTGRKELERAVESVGYTVEK